jgi:hypothetical protein
VAEELIPGRDGSVCLVKLRAISGLLLRPFHRIYPLEIYDEGISKPADIRGCGPREDRDR